MFYVFFFFPYHTYGERFTPIAENVGYISNKIRTFGNKNFPDGYIQVPREPEQS